MGRRKTNSKFLEEIADRPFEALEPYQTNKIPIRFRCNIDGHEWTARPANILSEKGCPLCGNRRSSETQTGKNEILAEDNGVVLVDISTPTHPEAIMLCDKDVWDRFEGGRVLASTSSASKYIYACYSEGGRPKKFHHLVLTPPDGFQIDHLTHGSMTYIDNTRANLRICTTSQNCRNQSLRVNSTSGVTGVSWNNSRGKWVAQITVNKKHTYLGLFHSKEDAIQARRDAEETYFGKFAYSENN